MLDSVVSDSTSRLSKYVNQKQQPLQHFYSATRLHLLPELLFSGFSVLDRRFYGVANYLVSANKQKQRNGSEESIWDKVSRKLGAGFVFAWHIRTTRRQQRLHVWSINFLGNCRLRVSVTNYWVELVQFCAFPLNLLGYFSRGLSD